MVNTRNFKTNIMNEQKKPICLHFHIFKNAGSTIDWILDKNFSKNHLSLDDLENRGGRLQWDGVLKLLNQNPDVKAFSSHQLRFPVSNNTNYNFLPMIFIRHPIDRAFSIYGFKKRSTDDSLGTVKAKSMTLKGFIQWNIDLEINRTMKNFQVLYLSDKDTKSSVDSNDLQLAIDRLRTCPILGVVNRLDESLVLAEEYLRQFFTDIDFSYIKQNVSNDRKNDLEVRLIDERNRIGESLSNQLNQLNELDFKLYSIANNELDKRIEKERNFEKKLTDFKKRCQSVAKLRNKNWFRKIFYK